MELGRPTRESERDRKCPECDSQRTVRRGEERETFDNGQTVVKREHYTCEDCNASWWEDVWPDDRVYVSG
jgi:transposase-like protein